MKIIQHGDPEKLKRILGTKTFFCSTCGCVFEADLSEYSDCGMYRKPARRECPECHKVAFEKEADSI